MKFTNMTVLFLSTLMATTSALPNAIPNPAGQIDDSSADAAFLNSLDLASLESKLSLHTRQVAGAMAGADVLRVQRILDGARSSGVGRVRARRLTEARERQCVKEPATECNACMDRAVTTTILAVLGCGTTVIAAGALTGGAAAILGATGFLICDGLAYEAYENQLMTCRAA
jgi:hypothetical protein